MKRRDVLETIGISVASLALVRCSQDAGTVRTEVSSAPTTDGPRPVKGAADATVNQNTASSTLVNVDSMVAMTVFSKANPGKWAGKEGTHAPTLSIADNKLQVATPHGMARDHYIMWHQLRNKAGTILAEVSFPQPAAAATPDATPVTLAPTIFDLAPFKLKAGDELRVYSLCNQHGIWVGTTTVA